MNKCEKCGATVVNGKHYMTEGKDTPAWTPEEIKVSEYADLLKDLGLI